jgi:hypothetical protein
LATLVWEGPVQTCSVARGAFARHMLISEATVSHWQPKEQLLQDRGPNPGC